tara:strand:- start:12415 stop:12843 length:429 start_codon:yes stop_codon:yes gene_type:complete
MLIKRARVNHHTKFNFELRKSFSSNTLFIDNQDIETSLCAINMLCEYIRASYFDQYLYHNKENLPKYCRLLLRFEQCNQSLIVKACKNACIKVLNDAINSSSSLKTMTLCFEMNESKNEQITELSNELMSLTLGSKVRAKNN